MARNPAARYIKVFISYRNLPYSQRVGEMIANALQEKYGFEVFIDTQKLRDQGGEIWEEAIYRNARTSDVLLVLLEPETSASNWVQREVDVARGASVSIVPVVIVPEADIRPHLPKVQDELAIRNLQYLRFNPDEPHYEILRKSIERQAKETRDKQRDWWDALDMVRRVKRIDSHQTEYAIYRLAAAPDAIRFCLAAGDITRMKGIDVLVNTENNYMQMARIYESDTLSSALRREGSRMQNGRILDDAVQKELDQQIADSPFKSRPIEIEQVIITHAGHPKSQLIQNGARYIIHAASVYVQPNFKRVTPIQSDESVQNIVCNCLKAFIEIDDHAGVISRRRRAGQLSAEEYAAKPIRSIVFPTFGTGRGGRPVAEVIEPMLDAIRSFTLEHVEYFRRRAGISIHLALHSRPDVLLAEAMLNQREDFVRIDGS